MAQERFWAALDRLVADSTITIDRPRGTPHPRYPDTIYPLDYGFLAGTTATDGDGVDVWIGSLPERRVTAVVCTVDLGQRDTEIKLLLGCTPEEAQTIHRVHNSDRSSGLLILRPGRDSNAGIAECDKGADGTYDRDA